LAVNPSTASRVAELYATDTGCTLQVAAVDPRLAIEGTRELLCAALGNLLQNAFKFTQPSCEVTLRARVSDGWILIRVEDRCGGLPDGWAQTPFEPFRQGFNDK